MSSTLLNGLLSLTFGVNANLQSETNKAHMLHYLFILWETTWTLSVSSNTVKDVLGKWTAGDSFAALNIAHHPFVVQTICFRNPNPPQCWLRQFVNVKCKHMNKCWTCWTPCFPSLSVGQILLKQEESASVKGVSCSCDSMVLNQISRRRKTCLIISGEQVPWNQQIRCHSAG